MTQVIDFYDIPCKNEGVYWNPNTMKTRYTLNYKGLAFRTIWVEYPDIEATCRKLGVLPTSTKPDGSPLYTFPVIHDPNTGVSISESLHIAEYLDKTYPDTPRVIAPGTRALQAAFIDTLMSSKVTTLFQFLMPKAAYSFNKRSEDYFTRTRQEFFGVSIEDMYPRGEKVEEAFKKVEADFGVINGWLKEESEFIMGDKVSFADFALGGVLKVSKTLFGEDSLEWKRIAEWHNGRWGRFAKSLEKYEQIA
ncbi:hypothetical protein Moror_16013 [Moniliophthora roreri MCA 2997]|uniref:GST N-terminal domain-containing protein n=2 Tax=Moniliophthora roreri TaxID=221103 RepID=V2XJM8_MONRO|nr:hypothetical protein Moror_16013 [Moniliophthora roreri MCA 2997]